MIITIATPLPISYDFTPISPPGFTHDTVTGINNCLRNLIRPPSAIYTSVSLGAPPCCMPFKRGPIVKFGVPPAKRTSDRPADLEQVGPGRRFQDQSNF